MRQSLMPMWSAWPPSPVLLQALPGATFCQPGLGRENVIPGRACSRTGNGGQADHICSRLQRVCTLPATHSTTSHWLGTDCSDYQCRGADATKSSAKSSSKVTSCCQLLACSRTMSMRTACWLNTACCAHVFPHCQHRRWMLRLRS